MDKLQVDSCGSGKKAVICDARLRTYNVGADCNSREVELWPVVDSPD